jgi:hypothetical protein
MTLLDIGSCIAGMALLCVFAPGGHAQESSREFRYSFALVDDATRLNGLIVAIPKFQNEILLEPAFSLRLHSRWSFASSLVGLAGTDGATHIKLRVKETYAGLSAGDFDFTVGRRIVRWGTGYAFTAAGVLDPPRVPTDPTDRLNLNAGRDMVKADWVVGPHALSLVWSSAALSNNASTGNFGHDTTAVRYNVLMHGFDTSLIAGDDRGGDAFGGLTFTRVLGDAWELHGEAMWREQAALLLGAKYTTKAGITFIGEFYTPPNIPAYGGGSISPAAGRQHDVFVRAGKTRLREVPGWKQWDVAASIIANLNDRSFTFVFDAERRFGNHFSSYLHMEAPQGNRSSQYGATPYTTTSSAGIRFQL